MNTEYYNKTAVNTASILIIWPAVATCGAVFNLLLGAVITNTVILSVAIIALSAVYMLPYYYLLVLIYRHNVTLFTSKPLIRKGRVLEAIAMMILHHVINISANLLIITFSLDTAIVKTVAIPVDTLVIYAMLTRRRPGIFSERHSLVIALTVIAGFTTVAAVTSLFSLHVMLTKYSVDHVLCPSYYNVSTFLLAIAISVTLTYLHTEAVEKLNERSDRI